MIRRRANIRRTRFGLSAVTLLAAVITARPAEASVVVDLEDLPLAPESFYNGADGAGRFISRGATFNNAFTDFGQFSVWSGWSYSNVTDNGTPGFGNQYSAIAGGGADGSATYAVAFVPAAGDATIELPASLWAESVLITNTTYAYFALRDGDQFSRRFGGETGEEPDFFRLTITGRDGDQQVTGVVDFYLADYRFTDNRLDYILDDWAEVDLTALNGATTLSFGLESSDVGPFGMNTPAYFALDSLHVVPEPTTLSMFLCGIAGLLRRGARRWG